MEGNPGDSLQERVIEVRLAIAHTLIANGRGQEAERIYKQALKHAEASTGPDSPITGMVLLDLFDLYEAQDRHGDAKPLWERIVGIVRLHAPKVVPGGCTFLE